MPDAPLKTKTKAKARTRKSEPMFVSKDGIIMFWFYLTVGTLAYTAWQVLSVCQAENPSRRYVIMARADVRRSAHVMTDDRLRERMEDEVHTIVDSIFNRSPTGLDREQSAVKYFTPAAWTSVDTDIATEAGIFKTNRIHQKVEIGNVSVEDMDSDAVTNPPLGADGLPVPAIPGAPRQILKRVNARGQLIRIGTVKKKGSDDQKLFHEVWDLRLVFEFEANGRLNANGVYPWMCRDLQVRRRLSSSDRNLEASSSPPTS